MKKGKINLACLLFSALVSLVAYGFLARIVFQNGWNFDLFSAVSWTHAQKEWENGVVLDKMFALALFLLLPGYIVAWVVTYLLPWKRMFFFPVTVLKERRQKALLQKSIQAAQIPKNPKAVLALKKTLKIPVHKGVKTPPDLGHIRAKKASVPESAKGTHHTPSASLESEHTNTIEMTDSDQTGNFIEHSSVPTPGAHISLDQRALNSAQLWEEIAETLEGKDVFTFREMKIGEYPTNLIAVTAEGIFILTQGPLLGEEWTLAEDRTPPVWSQGKDAISSPLRPLVQAREDVKKYMQENSEFGSLNVNACLILDHGTVTNPKDLIAYLEMWDISVLRMGSCGLQQIPTTKALLDYIGSQSASSQELNDAVAVCILDLMETNFETE